MIMISESPIQTPINNRKGLFSADITFWLKINVIKWYQVIILELSKILRIHYDEFRNRFYFIYVQYT